jgi:hypothetical protein
MPRSLRIGQGCIKQVKLAVRRNGFPSQRALSEDAGLSLATVSVSSKAQIATAIIRWQLKLWAPRFKTCLTHRPELGVSAIALPIQDF